MFRVISTVLKRTDYKRWADPCSLEPWWEPRTRKIATLVPPHSRIIEFGAGNGQLERYLDASCTYVRSDIIARGQGTIICDLNRRPLPDLEAGAYDVAVFIGVLEYLRDVPSMLDWLGKRIPLCVVSYVCAKANPFSFRGMREAFIRRQMGWMNSYGEDELRALFRDRGFVHVREAVWENNHLFLFSQWPLPLPTTPAE